VKVPSGPFWWMPKKTEPKPVEEESWAVICDEPPPSLSRSSTMTRFFSKEPASDMERPVVGRAATNPFWPVRKNSKDIAVLDDAVQRPIPRKAKSEGTVVLSSEGSSKALPPLPDGSGPRL
jgi:hypothetical protein